jgi:hypothetical protein
MMHAANSLIIKEKQKLARLMLIRGQTVPARLKATPHTEQLEEKF